MVLALARESGEHVLHVVLRHVVELFPGGEVATLEHALQGLRLLDHGAALEAVEQPVKAVFNNQEIAFNDLGAGVPDYGEVHLDAEAACHGFGVLFVFHDLVATALAGEVAVAVFATVVHVDFFRETVALDAVAHGSQGVLGAGCVVVQAPAHGHVGLEVHEERDVAGGGLFLPLHLHEHVPCAGIAHPYLPRLEFGVVTVEVVALVIVELLLAFAGEVDDIGRELALEPAHECRLTREIVFALAFAAFLRLAERNHPAGKRAQLVCGKVGGLEVVEHRVGHGGTHGLAVVDERNLAAVLDRGALAVDALDARLHFGVGLVPLVHETPEFLGARDAFALEQNESPLVEVLLCAVGGAVIASDDRLHVLCAGGDFGGFGQGLLDIAVRGLGGKAADIDFENLAPVLFAPAVVPHGDATANLPVGNPEKLRCLR